MRRVTVSILVLLSVMLGRVPASHAGKERKVIEREDGKYVHLSVEGDPAAQGWLLVPITEEEEGEEQADSEEASGRLYDLVVALHGAGGIPKNFVLPLLMAERDAYCLTVAGRRRVETERGEGYMWSGGDVETIVTLVRHVLGTHPIAPDRVIVWGHSAGGTMTLATLAKEPDLFAGALTTAAPATPDGRHKSKRVAVFLGTEDPNWAGAPAIRSYAERVNKKRGSGACAFFAVEGLEHELPYDDYLGFGFDWILAGHARGGEATVPRRSRGREGAYHHLLVRYKGVEGATGEARKRKRSRAERVLKDVRKALQKKRAFFPFEAAVHSEHEETAACGGGIDEDDLAELLGEVPTLEPGALSDVLESPHGLHLVWRPPADADEEEDDDE